VPINGEPLLSRWLGELEKIGCERVLINTHHLAEQVNEYLKGWHSKTMLVETFHETCLLGTAGTLIANQRFFQFSTGLLIHADNVMEEGLLQFLRAHTDRQDGCLMTMLTFNTSTPSSCGIVEVGEDLVAQGFHEKIRNPPGNTANGAVYAFDHELLDYLNSLKKLPQDFSTEVIHTLLGKIQTYHTNKTYMDIGTPDAFASAQSLFKGIK
jgi:mannose-1-phosphate guanylyltransferase